MASVADKGGNKMKKLFFGTILLALGIVVPIPAMAAVDINVNISLPPPIVFAAPPVVIVLPDTNDVYVVPDIDVDLFSGTVGGGVYGKVVGTAHIIITGVGVTIGMFQVFILM